MPKKKEAVPAVAPSKKSAKPAKVVPVKKAAPKVAKAAKAKPVEAPAKASKKAAPKPATRKNAKHEPVSDEVVLGAFDKVPTGLLTKAELVAACGGDESAVTKTVNKLRGQGKIVVRGTTRSAVYSKAT